MPDAQELQGRIAATFRHCQEQLFPGIVMRCSLGELSYEDSQTVLVLVNSQNTPIS